VDHAALSAVLIAQVRGKMSQAQLSRRLGYASNVVYLWEQRRRLPPVGVFLRAAELRRRTFRAELQQFFGISPLPATSSAQPLGDSATVAALLRQLARGQSALELGRRTGFDRTTIARWLRGRTQPRLPDFLRFLETTNLRLLEFVALFADPAELELTSAAHREQLQRQRLAYEQPWSHAVLHALELDAYQALPRHRPTLLAAQLGLPPSEVEIQLQRLADAHLIERHEGRWRPARMSSLDTRGDFTANRRLKQHWASVAVRRIEQLQPNQQSLFSFNLFPIGHADFARLRELHLDYYERVRQLVAEARGADHVVVLNVQLCRLDEVPA
jgi:transcriptional regulator with XRE-family HTH domain